MPLIATNFKENLFRRKEMLLLPYSYLINANPLLPQIIMLTIPAFIYWTKI